MTKSRRPDTSHTSLKVMLATGALLASLAGTRLLAAQDAAAGLLDDDSAVQTVVVPATTTTLTGPPSGVTVELAPIPDVVAPELRPVARSRSSR